MSQHILEPNGGYIGGSDSPHPGPRRPVAACSRPGCTAFRRDNGSVGRLDSLEDAAAQCAGAAPGPLIPHTSAPNDWTMTEWRIAIADLRRPTDQELEFISLRQKMAETKSTPTSFASDTTQASPIEGLRALSDFIDGVKMLAAPEPNEDIYKRFNSTVLRLCDREGAVILAGRLADFARRRESDIVQLHQPDGTRVKWAWFYIRSISNTYNRHLAALPPTVEIPSFVDVLASRFTWPTEPETEHVNLQTLRVKTYIIHALSVISPAKYAGPEATFYSKLCANLLENFYRKVVLGKANVAAHLKYIEKGSLHTKQNWTAKKSTTTMKRTPHPTPATKRPRPDEEGAAPIHHAKDAEAKDKTKYYTHCLKCRAPVPERFGGKSRQQHCVKCRVH
jgi:hypothetical protein